MNHERALVEQISTVERKLEIRRERASRHLQQTRDELKIGIESGKKWAPLVLVGALGAAAFAAGRRRRDSIDFVGECVERQRSIRSPGVLATAAAVAGLVARVVLAPQTRDLWRLWRSSRPGLGERTTTVDHQQTQRSSP